MQASGGLLFLWPGGKNLPSFSVAAHMGETRVVMYGGHKTNQQVRRSFATEQLMEAKRGQDYETFGAKHSSESNSRYGPAKPVDQPCI